MFTHISFPKEPISIVGQNEEKEKTFNDDDYNSLKIKREAMKIKYDNFPSDKPEDFFNYRIFHPFFINFNRNTKFQISKESLNKLLNDLGQKRNHKEIYNTNLFELSNLYHLIEEKKYISKKCVTEELKEKLKEEEEEMNNREYVLSPDKYYDKNNKMVLNFVSKNDKYNKVSNSSLIKRLEEKTDILVQIKNEDDYFCRYFQLNHRFKIKDLKSLITFIYMKKLCVNNVGKISLFYYNDNYERINLNNDNRNLQDIAKEMKRDYKIELYFNIDY